MKQVGKPSNNHPQGERGEPVVNLKIVNYHRQKENIKASRERVDEKLYNMKTGS